MVDLDSVSFECLNAINNIASDIAQRFSSNIAVSLKMLRANSELAKLVKELVTRNATDIVREAIRSAIVKSFDSEQYTAMLNSIAKMMYETIVDVYTPYPNDVEHYEKALKALKEGSPVLAKVIIDRITPSIFIDFKTERGEVVRIVIKLLDDSLLSREELDEISKVVREINEKVSAKIDDYEVGMQLIREMIKTIDDLRRRKQELENGIRKCEEEWKQFLRWLRKISGDIPLYYR